MSVCRKAWEQNAFSAAQKVSAFARVYADNDGNGKACTAAQEVSTFAIVYADKSGIGNACTAAKLKSLHLGNGQERGEYASRYRWFLQW